MGAGAPPAVGGLRADQRERRQRIVVAARRLMVTVDYDRIQVRDVADEADVALGTLYRYFGSKDHLFAWALVEWSASFGTRVGRTATRGTAGRVKAVYRSAARAFEREPRVYGAMIAVQRSRDEHAGAVFREFSSAQTEVFGRALEEIPAPRRDDVIAVMGAVLSANLLAWQLGSQPAAAVRTAIDRAADLIFDPPA